MLAENDAKGSFVQSLGDGLFSHLHGLRVDSNDNLWTIDGGNHLVLKLNPAGNVLLVLGRINTGTVANWLFNKPADLAFARNGDIYVADGYGNSRVVKFDGYGNYINSWGKFGADIGEFNFASRRRGRQSGPRISRRSRKSTDPDLRRRRQIHPAMDRHRLPLQSADHARPAHLDG
jgi:NHL repeat